MRSKTNNHPAVLLAETPDDIAASLKFMAVPVEIQAGDAEQKKLPRFSMVAYTGGPMRINGFPRPVTVDFSGLEIPKQNLPVRLDHESTKGVGHTDRVAVENGELIADGIISRDTSWAKDVTKSGKNGFPWQASIGAQIVKAEFVPAGRTVQVNGQTVIGPAHVVRRAILKEISFVDSGADANTSAKIAAKNSEENDMDPKFKKWLEAKDFDPEKLEAGQEKFLKAAYEAELAAAAADEKSKTDPPKKVEASGEQTDPAAKVEAAGEQTDPTTQMRAAAAAESKRIAAITKLCAGGKHADIEAKAIAEGWNETKVELEVLRASRPTGPAIHDGDRETGPQVLEAAVLMGGGIRGDELLDSHGEQVVEAADKNFRRGIGLQQLLLEAAWAGGYTGRSFQQDHEGVLQAAFSTLSLPGILSNVANKFLLAGFMSVEDAWRQIAAIRPVKDFKTVTSYRMTSGMEYEEVGPTGELKHGDVGEESYTNQAKTYGKMFVVTRQDQINDDLGAITAVPKRLGRGGALKFNKVFWTAFMNNSTFFKTANKNYKAGAATALSIDALTAAILLFLEQVDADGNPVAVTPRKLLVPAALDVTGTQLMSSLKLNETTTANKAKPTDNPHAGKFDVVMSRYLSDSTISGYSALAWHLLADPADLAVIEAVFLNGQQNPTVEQAMANFNTLGIQFRGYFDFGVALQEHRAGVKMKGEV